MIQMLIHFFRDYPFLLNAFLASILVSICAGIVGSLVVSSKSVFFTGGVAHGAFGGVGLALFFGFSTTLGAGIAAILMAILMGYIRLKYQSTLDSYIAALWALGMAIGVICMDLSQGYGQDLSSYLFGSIISVSKNDLYLIGIFDLVLLIFVLIFYYEILSIFYDNDFCRLKKIKIHSFTIVSFVLISLGVIMSMSVAGLILVISILSIPAYIAALFAPSLRVQMFLSSLFSLLFMWIGFWFSYQFNLSIGACVVIASVVALFLVLLFKKCQKEKIWNKN